MNTKPTWQETNKAWPDAKEEKALENILKNGPPFAAAIVAAAMIEHMLERLLLEKLIKLDHETWERLTGQHGPLGGLSAKIQMGFALGLYDRNLRDNLDTVRRVRNLFAHSKRPMGFGDKKVIKVLSEVKLPAAKRSGHSKYIRWTREFVAKRAYRAAFVMLVLATCLRLTKKLTRFLRAQNVGQARRIANRQKRINALTGPGALSQYGLALAGDAVAKRLSTP